MPPSKLLQTKLKMSDFITLKWVVSRWFWTGLNSMTAHEIRWDHIRVSAGKSLELWYFPATIVLILVSSGLFASVWRCINQAVFRQVHGYYDDWINIFFSDFFFHLKKYEFFLILVVLLVLCFTFVLNSGIESSELIHSKKDATKPNANYFRRFVLVISLFKISVCTK